MTTHYDLIILGKGLAGSLCALNYQLTYPQHKLLILEAQPFSSARHTWSCFESDWPQELTQLKDFLKKYQSHWASHQVQFPELRRELSVGYQSLRESDLLRAWQDTESPSRHCYFNVSDIRIQKISSDLFQVQAQQSHQPLLATSNQLWDARGWEDWNETPCAYQKFIGWEVELSHPHQLEAPLIMDAQVEQIDGYRFFYLLPYTNTRLLIEDTYYSNFKDLDKKTIDLRIAHYAQSKGWIIKEIIHQEQGVLPLPLLPPSIPKGLGSLVGARGLQFHPVTGYTLPFLLRQISLLTINSKDLKLSLHPAIWYQLNNFLFTSRKPEQRIEFFKFFYRLPETIVTNFFSGQMSKAQWLSFFTHWPPPIKVTEAFLICSNFIRSYIVRCMTNKHK